MKKMRRLLFCSLWLFAVACSTPADNTTGNSAPAQDLSSNEVVLSDEQIKSIGLELGKLEIRQLSGTVKASGMLDVPPQNLVTISAPMGGFVKRTELLQGMAVKKGQVVVVLEHPDYIQLQQDYLEGRSQLEFLEEDYKRQEELAKENVNAVKALQQSKSNYLSTKARVQGLVARLALINIEPKEIESAGIKNEISILSPLTGFVMQVNVNLGMYVNPADVMFKLVDTHHLHAEAQVFEKDISKLKIGQTVRLTLSNENKERKATVYLIGKEITLERTVRVHCHLDQEDHSLIPGMFFNSVIETGAKPSRCAPESALVNFEGKSYLFVARKDNRFEMTEVTLGPTQSGFVEVTLPAALDSTVSIVTKGTFALVSKLKNVE